ncbi:MAG TPA: MgtC/SapB family protein [Stellaceae bacterium]|nr:MgtC/SapB family protein [Stellaceae bacterium]
MMAMTPSLRWTEVALRLALTIGASILLGYNRSEHGKAAGMRTTLLVCLAASVAMLQVNALLPTAGRAPNSFVMNDLMRLPLGILTGVGFIGGGAILRRGDMVVGVTTAATLWLATVIGLCLGGGQIALGLAATVLGLFALWVLKWVENRLRQESDARLSLTVDASGPGEAEIRRRLRDAGLSIFASRVDLSRNGMHRELVLEVRQLRLPRSTETPAPIAELARAAGVVRLQWQERHSNGGP